jgi:hypothetical protein
MFRLNKTSQAQRQLNCIKGLPVGLLAGSPVFFDLRANRQTGKPDSRFNASKLPFE